MGLGLELRSSSLHCKHSDPQSQLRGHVLYFVMGSHIAQAGPELAMRCSDGQGKQLSASQTPPLAEELSPDRGEHSLCIPDSVIPGTGHSVDLIS